MPHGTLTLCLALRLHPPGIGTSREARYDTTIPVGGGYDQGSPVFIPKGTRIMYSFVAMHRRKDIYGPDADIFKPERWESLHLGWEFLPFGGGPRICIGRKIPS